MRALAIPIFLFMTVTLAGCAQSEQPRPDYDPGVTAQDFVGGIDNEWLPLKPGAWWTYELHEDGDVERVEVEVTNETKRIMGVDATVVRDIEYLNGERAEVTDDWFAQDTAGNVWYLGEETCEYEDGECVDTGGSWQWGVDGALPGIVMWAHPVANHTAYFQEFYWGEAVDEAKVIDTGREVEVPAGTFDDTITTEEWNRLEKGSGEYAHYARGVGVILKEPTDGDPGEELIDYFVPE